MDHQTLLNRYTYDPLDRLASRTPLAEVMAQRFYKAGQLVTEVQGSEHRTYLRSDTHLLAGKNQSASTLLATDPQNSVLHADYTTIAYTPYGHHEAVISLPGVPGFNGEQPDPITGHYLLGNGYRAYNPTLMRFNSPDSLSPFGNGGLNAYAYCLGDPVNRGDPTGHMWGSIATFFARMSRSFRSLFWKPDRRLLTELPDVPFQNLSKYLSGNDMNSLRLVSSGMKERVDHVSAQNFGRLMTQPYQGRVGYRTPFTAWEKMSMVGDKQVAGVSSAQAGKVIPGSKFMDRHFWKSDPVPAGTRGTFPPRPPLRDQVNLGLGDVAERQASSDRRIELAWSENREIRWRT